MATSDWYSDPLAGSSGIAVIEDAGSGASQNGLTKATLHATVDGGSLTATPPRSSTANTPAIVTSGGDVIAANTSRKQWSIQNLGTNPLFVRMGTGASSTVFHFILAPGTVNDDGKGGLAADDVWQGIVSATGTSPRFTVLEET